MQGQGMQGMQGQQGQQGQQGRFGPDFQANDIYNMHNQYPVEEVHLDPEYYERIVEVPRIVVENRERIVEARCPCWVW